jgi:hypothetical protein
MIGLIMLGSVINYRTRSTLSVAAPTLLEDLRISTPQYSWVVGTFQGAIMLQPLCGYVMDVIGLKRGFALSAASWSLISMAHGPAHNRQPLAILRGLLGLAEGPANPAGMKATAEWFPAPELPDVFTAPTPIAADGPLHLRVEADYERLRSAFRVGGGEWQWLPEQVDASILSDEAGPPGSPNFTGAIVEMCRQDLAGTGHPADFDYFECREREFTAKP